MSRSDTTTLRTWWTIIGDLGDYTEKPEMLLTGYNGRNPLEQHSQIPDLYPTEEEAMKGAKMYGDQSMWGQVEVVEIKLVRV